MKTLQKLHLKVAYGSLDFFLCTHPTAQNGPKLQIHFENLAVDLSLYFLSRDHTKDG